MAWAYQGRGTAWMNKVLLERAIVDFNRAIELDPTLAPAYINRGLSLLLLGKDKEAQEDFERSIALNPSLKVDLEQRIQLARQFRQGTQ